MLFKVSIFGKSIMGLKFVVYERPKVQIIIKTIKIFWV